MPGRSTPHRPKTVLPADLAVGIGRSGLVSSAIAPTREPTNNNPKAAKPVLFMGAVLFNPIVFRLDAASALSACVRTVRLLTARQNTPPNARPRLPALR